MKENKMKPKRAQKNILPSWQGKGVTTDYKTPPSQAKPASRVSSGAQVKPLTGKVFYLDLPSDRRAETLESDIKELGGTVEKFFSKDIRYLVSDKMEARLVRNLGQESPVASPNSGQSSPHPHSKSDRPGNNGDNLKSKTRNQTETSVASRGKTLVERVVKEQGRVQMNKILSNALELGVKILHVDDVIAYIKKKKKVVGTQSYAPAGVKVKAELVAKKGFHKYIGGRISKPFVKVEDSSRHYRPIYLTMPLMPQFYLKAIPPCCPFFLDDKDPTGNKQRGHRDVHTSAGEERARGRRNRDKKRGGYCECCMIKYENVTTHLQSACHKEFSKSDEYFVVDKLVSTMHFNFLQMRTQVKRPKCSVSSALIVPGPSGEPNERLKWEPNTTEIIKEEQHRTIERHEGSYSGHTTVPLILREEDMRSNDSHSDRSNHKVLGPKWPCRQTSLTSCSQKAPRGKTETASFRGKCCASISSRDSRVNQVDQIKTEDMNSSSSHFHNINRQNVVPSKSRSVETNQQEESDTKHEFSVFQSVQGGTILHDNISGNSLTEKEEGSFPIQRVSPLRKIQRRIRAYKRLRRKVDPYIERVKQRESLYNSKLKLLELFLSSDDMDVEFLGFEH